MKYLHTKFIALLMAFVMVFSMSMTAFAVDASDKEAKQNEIDALEEEKAEQAEVLEELEADKAATEAEIEALDAELEALQIEIDATNAELARVQAELEQTKKDLEVAREKERQQYETLKLRIKVMYEKGDTGYLEILFAAKDMASFLNSTEYISKISDYDNNLLNNLMQTRMQIEELEKQLEAQQAELEALKAELEAQQAELEILLEEKAEHIRALNDSIAYTQEVIAELEDSIRKEEQALYEIQQAISQQASSGGYVPNVSGSSKPAYGSWIWPSDTYYLTDTFGYQAWRGGLHNGIDIGAPHGSPIYAAASGTVWIAGWSSSAGNWVVIDHGGGVLSVYMHASALYVSSGQYVDAGTCIAAVGNTGYSFGAHLHFGIMVGSSGGYNGYWVDPLGYVSP
ncbi:MAG: peptidoglycan DD-metalloendopeptidase family protein [Lachnospiraceae bacterium]|nr:peptidoglycan DD-metalloendopeptidase family protein [Lachnospiraceae bacterium]